MIRHMTSTLIPTDTTPLAGILAALGTRDRRKLAAATYATRSGDIVTVTYHDTAIVVYDLAADTCTVDTGGWLTMTTVGRINAYAPIRLATYGGVYVASSPARMGGWLTALYDGLVTSLDGLALLSGYRDPAEVRAARDKVSRDILAYVDRYREPLARWGEEVRATGRISTAGDPWCCAMVTADGRAPIGEGTDHLWQHIRERYTFPALLFRALAYRRQGPEVMVYWPEHALSALTEYLRANLYPAGCGVKGGRMPGAVRPETWQSRPR